MVEIKLAELSNPVDAGAAVFLLNEYAKDAMAGNGELSNYVKENLVSGLQKRPGAYALLAYVDGKAAGLAICFEGFSTFAARPLVNIHDVVVLAGYRGQRVGEQMLARVEAIAVARGACKLTLEMLSGNASAARLYQRIGFADYQLDPAMGHAVFMQKWLGA